MNGWKLLLEGVHETLMAEEDGEIVDPEYRYWNDKLANDPSLTREQRNELLYNMTQRCYEELTDGLRVKDLMGDMEEALTHPTNLKVEWALDAVHYAISVDDDLDVDPADRLVTAIDEYLEEGSSKVNLVHAVEGIIGESWHDGQTRDCAEAVVDRLLEQRRRERSHGR